MLNATCLKVLKLLKNIKSPRTSNFISNNVE
jgi:hypothetical protein